MPCNSDYLEPTNLEVELQRAAILLIYVRKALNQKPEPWLTKAAKSIYGEGGKRAIPLLCAALKSLPPRSIAKIVYNAKNRTARDLADWWEDHQAADREREKSERERMKQRKLRSSALSKLSKGEREALLGVE
jgi:hypothetical protein